MAHRKKSKSVVPIWLAGVGKAAHSVPPGAALAVVMAVALAAGLFHAWRRWGITALEKMDHRVQLEKLQLTPPPEWVLSDIAAEVFRNGSLGELSLLDDELTLKVHAAFELNPWIASVDRVGKRADGCLFIKLQYRRPVAWVEVPAKMTNFDNRPNQPGVLAVDREARPLPVLAEQYATLELVRISVPDPEPWSMAGQVWHDPRIIGAAKIADLLSTNWSELAVHSIRARPWPGGGALSDQAPVFEIVYTDGSTYTWGSAPGGESPNELSIQEKIDHLRAGARRATAARGTAAPAILQRSSGRW